MAAEIYLLRLNLLLALVIRLGLLLFRFRRGLFDRAGFWILILFARRWIRYTSGFRDVGVVNWDSASMPTIRTLGLSYHDPPPKLC
jgi:hypothetical protein